MSIDVKALGYKEINEALRKAPEVCTLDNCCGQRFIAAGMSGREITINGVPGNALGAYLNGATIKVNANAQDA
ncbi:MAG: glutamate synthase, partial [Oscillospiraceae bacterium]